MVRRRITAGAHPPKLLGADDVYASDVDVVDSLEQISTRSAAISATRHAGPPFFALRRLPAIGEAGFRNKSDRFHATR